MRLEVAEQPVLRVASLALAVGLAVCAGSSAAAGSVLASSLLAACGSSAVSPTTAANTVDCDDVFLPVREGASWT